MRELISSKIFITILRHERDVSAEAACEFLHKGFRGYAGYVATGAIRIQADALSWHDRMLGQWRGSLFERLGWAPIQSGIEKRHGVAGPSLSVEGRRDTDP